MRRKAQSSQYRTIFNQANKGRDNSGNNNEKNQPQPQPPLSTLILPPVPPSLRRLTRDGPAMDSRAG